MKTKLFVLLAFLTIATASFAQVKQEDKSITINFTETEIFINDSKCFGYSKKGNDFSITDNNGKEIIKGVIRKNLRGSFESVIMFLNVGKTFTNKKVVGRNDLIFSLINYKVIGPGCQFNIDKLNKFIEENNSL